MNNKEIEEEEKAPKSLIVLAVLSFIGILFSFLVSLGWFVVFSLKNEENFPLPESQQHELRKLFDVLSQSGIDTDNMEVVNKLKYTALLLIIASVISLFGVIFMLLKKKKGFYTYVVGQVIAIFGPVLFVGLGYYTLMPFGNMEPFIYFIYIGLFASYLKYFK